MTTQRPSRFCLNALEARSGAEWRAKARRAEELGFTTFSIANHIGFGSAYSLPGPVAGLMAAAEATSSIRLGSLVFANDFRHPALLAIRPPRSTCSAAADWSSVWGRARRRPTLGPGLDWTTGTAEATDEKLNWVRGGRETL